MKELVLKILLWLKEKINSKLKKLKFINWNKISKELYYSIFIYKLDVNFLKI